jgi:hypothetical protein
MPVTLLSQRKLPLTARNKLLHYKIIGAPKKFKNWARPYLGLEIIINVNKNQIQLVRQSL